MGYFGASVLNKSTGGAGGSSGGTVNGTGPEKAKLAACGVGKSGLVEFGLRLTRLKWIANRTQTSSLLELC